MYNESLNTLNNSISLTHSMGDRLTEQLTVHSNDQHFPALKEPTLDRKGLSLDHTVCQLNASNTAIPHLFNVIHKRSLQFRFSEKKNCINFLHPTFLNPLFLHTLTPCSSITIRCKLLYAYKVRRKTIV
jgi:hypothetical protein